MTRFWPEGMPIGVDVDELAAPAALTWEGRRHAVVQIVERWRVDEGWWRRRAWREYVQLVTGDGLLLLVYHDVRARRWYLQRVYD